MIKTFGHHTIEKTTESVATRLKIGPVKSTVLDENGMTKEKPPFAGDGYYFWEDNLPAADWWGSVHYVDKGKQYRIFRVNIELRYDDNSLLDLIGSRQHLKLLGQLIRKARMALDCEGWTLEKYISYFRLRESKLKGMFPYKMIRFNDYSLNPKIQDYIPLRDAKHISLMNPFYIICVFEARDLDLATFAFIK